jgi:hypothetical protein
MAGGQDTDFRRQLTQVERQSLDELKSMLQKSQLISNISPALLEAAGGLSSMCPEQAALGSTKVLACSYKNTNTDSAVLLQASESSVYLLHYCTKVQILTAEEVQGSES